MEGPGLVHSKHVSMRILLARAHSPDESVRRLQLLDGFHSVADRQQDEDANL